MTRWILRGVGFRARRARSLSVRVGALVTLLFGSAVGSIFLANPAAAQTKGVPGNATAAEQRALLRAVCEGEVRGASCRVCPSYTDDGSGQAIAVGPFQVGSFVTPNAREAYVQLFGCDTNIGGYIGGVAVERFVGSVLLRRTGSSSNWKVVRYDSGVSLDTCLRFRYETGTSMFVCEFVSGGQGIGASAVQAVYTGPKDTLTRPIIAVQTNSDACFATWGNVSLTGWRSIDLDGDRLRDLELSVAEQRGSWAGLDCGNDKPKGGPTVIHRLGYRFDGRKFEVLPLAKRTHECLFAESESSGADRGTRYCPTTG